MSSFNDDDDVQVPNQIQDESDQDSETFKSRRTNLKINNKKDAPLTESKFKVLLELTGADTVNERNGVDIVAVLDVSGSMEEENRFESLKTAMRFLIKKLSHLDRLSIVTFSSRSDRKCPLHQMTENNQKMIENLVVRLPPPNGGTNITAGLKIAARVINERRITSGRRCAIMLMSDGIPSRGTGDATKVDVGNVPLYTFGLGKGHDAKVLHGIAKNGGVYSVASSGNDKNTSSLNTAFATCLAGLLYVVVEDLTLTITKVKSEITKVSAGDYIPSEDKAAGTQTVTFGFLYSGEKRRVMVEVLLPAVRSQEGTDTIEVSYSYRAPGGKKVIDINPVMVTVTRTASPVSKEDEEVVMEDARNNTVDKMKEAKDLADKNLFDDAKDKLKEADKELDDLKRDANELIKALKYEVQEFTRLLKDSDTYRKEGLPFVLAALLSHGLQRFAPRGDVSKLLKAFAVPLAIAYAEQASAFDKDPEMDVPSAEEDKKQAEEIKKEIMETKAAEAPKVDAKDLIASKADLLNQQVGQIIQSLTAIQDIINSLRST